MDALVQLDRYVLEVLMRDLVRHDRRPAAYLVYLAVAGEGRSVTSHTRLADRTGLSRRAVQDAVRHLAGRGLLRVERRGSAEPAVLTALTPWRRG